MSDAVIAQKAPFPVELTEGQKVFWCSCGRSSKQPFCDGSHKGTDFTPVAFEAPAAKTYYFCGCKASAKAPARPPVGASLADDPNPFGGYTPPKPQRERNLSSGAAFVTGGVGHLSLDLPPDMAGMVVPEGADAGPTSLTPCETCGRKFNAKALVIHARSCARVFATKRSQFDAKGMRATGTDLERFNREKGGGAIGGRDDESRARPTASRAPRAHRAPGASMPRDRACVLILGLG